MLPSHNVTRPLLAAWFVASVCFAPAPVRAEADDWLLLPATITTPDAGTPASRQAAQQIARALINAGVRVTAPERARASFEQRGSTAPLMVSHGDLDALARDTQMALYHVASGLPGKARADVERALARADKVLESLNREAVAAQQLLDACLYLVRAHLQDRSREAAREQALECRRLVPDIEPDGTVHPPDVIGVLAEAEAALRQREPGSLRVESLPEGCGVFLNGRHLGKAPVELPQLSPGEYRVQAECQEGRAGRVHRVTVASSRVVMRIDTRLDAAVQTSLDLSLHYDSAALQHEHAYADAIEVARVLGEAQVLLVLPVAGPDGALTDVVQVDLVRARDGALLAAVRLRVHQAGAIESAALGAAVATLRQGAQLDHTQAVAAPIADIDTPARIVAPRAPTPAEAAPALAAISTTPGQGGDAATEIEPTDSTALDDGDHERPPTLTGIVLAISGGAVTLTGLGLFAYQVALELDYSDKKRAGDVDGRRALKKDLEEFEIAPLVVTGSGALVLTASLPWLLPEAPELPPLAVVSGIAAGVLAVTGTVLLAIGSGCDDFDVEGRCTDIIATTRIGGLLLEGSVPLIGVPLVYLLRGDRGPGHASAPRLSLAARAAPEGRGAMLQLQGVM